MTTRLVVRVHPGARREGVRGWHGDGSLKLDLAAPAEGGRANEALVRVLAEVLGVRRTSIAVASGHASRKKTIAIEGVDAAEARRRIDARTGTAEETDGDDE